jgi:elongation factor Ts
MTYTITPAMIKELRERTGVGMGKCKEALEEAKGDIDLAIANLRKAGMATAVKKEGRTTNEGLIGAAETSSAIAVVEVNAETDFVVKNDRFKQFLENIAQEIALAKPSTLEEFLQKKYSKDPALTVDQYRATVVHSFSRGRISQLESIPTSAEKLLPSWRLQAAIRKKASLKRSLCMWQRHLQSSSPPRACQLKH